MTLLHCSLRSPIAILQLAPRRVHRRMRRHACSSRGVEVEPATRKQVGPRSFVVRWRVGTHGDLRLSDLLAALSVATDLGMGQQPEKAVRSCLLATGLGRALGLPDEEVRDVYFASLMRHLGCTATASLEARLFGGDELASRRAAEPADFGNRREMLALTLGTGRGSGPRRPLLVGRAVAGDLLHGRDILASVCEAGARARRATRARTAGRERDRPAVRALGRQGRTSGSGGRRDHAPGADQRGRDAGTAVPPDGRCRRRHVDGARPFRQLVRPVRRRRVPAVRRGSAARQRRRRPVAGGVGGRAGPRCATSSPASSTAWPVALRRWSI